MADEEERPAATTFESETVNNVWNHITPSSMTIENAMFGVTEGAVRSRTRATGPVPETDIAAAATGYVRPDGFTAAEKALHDEHAVVLHGPPDTGKRASTLMLLRTRTDAQLVLLSPQIALSELAERTYDEDTGYAVVDHVAEQNADDADFSWRLIRERLENAGAWLVVTTTTAPSMAAHAVQYVEWTPPQPRDVLAAHMSAPLSEHDRAVLVPTLADSLRLRDIVELAGRLDRGEPVEEAVGHVDATARHTVSEWFDRQPSRRRILEVTTLAFAVGADDRRFESMLAALERRLTVHLPEQESTEEVPAEKSLRQLRHDLTGADSLIVRRTVTSELGPRNELVFGSASYHRHVLAVLWDRMEVAFWDAVREWLDEQVAVDSRRVAYGLAWLADVAFAEVRSLLDAWARGGRGEAGQSIAILVLSTMAFSDELAPAALQTTTRWINSGDAAQRWTAAMTFSSELGMRFPHDAANKLWRLCVQAHTVTHNATVALGRLFVTLVRHTPDGGIVLSMLAGKLDRFDKAGGNVSMRSVAMTATLAVLSARDGVANRRAFLVFLTQSPERARTVARLWAAVLRHRPTRRRAITSLQGALKDLADHHENATAEVARLGAALAAEMTGAERDQLRTDMHRVADRRDAGTALAALVNALLNELKDD